MADSMGFTYDCNFVVRIQEFAESVTKYGVDICDPYLDH